MPFHFETPAPNGSLPIADTRPPRSQPLLRGNGVGRLSRRSFLAALLAGCGRLAVSPSSPAPRPDCWALLSDIHISADLNKKFGFSCMADNFRRVRDAVGEMGPRRVLINGDIGYMRGRSDDYASFLELSKPMRADGRSIHMTLGNHDHRRRFIGALRPDDDHAVSEKAVSARSVDGRQWIFLDSLEKTQDIRGSLGSAQLDWLRATLNTKPQTPTIVCLHHNPDPSPVGLKDHEAFQSLVLSRRQVKLVLFGHTHVFRTWQTHGLHFVNQPAVGYRLKPGSSLGWLSAEIDEDGMHLVFHGLNGSEPENKKAYHFKWRSA